LIKTGIVEMSSSSDESSYLPPNIEQVHRRTKDLDRVDCIMLIHHIG
jgi:hypothetical protein